MTTETTTRPNDAAAIDADTLLDDLEAGRIRAAEPDLTIPGGWRLIGQTPRVLFDPLRTPRALLQPGDEVRFVPAGELARSAQ